MKRVAAYIFLDILRNKVVLIYTLALSAMGWGVFAMEDTAAKGVLTILNVLLLIVPLVALVVATIYMYNSTEFIELMVSQPMKRSTLWRSLWMGLSGAMSAAYLVGIGIPLMVFSPDETGVMMVITGTLLSVVFVSLAMVCAIIARDKAKGIGMAMILWLYFAILFDGIVLMVVFQFADYPIERPMVALSMLNPITIARILILLRLDVSALMGYTGAVFKSMLDSTTGLIVAMGAFAAWIAIPYWFSHRQFRKKDL